MSGIGIDLIPLDGGREGRIPKKNLTNFPSIPRRETPCRDQAAANSPGWRIYSSRPDGDLATQSRMGPPDGTDKVADPLSDGGARGRKPSAWVGGDARQARHRDVGLPGWG